MSARTGAAAARRGERLALVAFLSGTRVGDVYQGPGGILRLRYDDAWRFNPDAYPLSLSMPLTAAEHRHDVTVAFLWGLLPDNDRVLDQYGRVFGVSARNPVALLSHLGADCAGAVQLAPPETAGDLEGAPVIQPTVEWLTEQDVAGELRSVRERGIPGISRRTLGRFSLAGAQPKIALLEENGRWGRPTGRTPTNRILKPPTGEFRGFAENEHFCLELAGHLGLGAVRSRVAKFDGEVAIVVERFDRLRRGRSYLRVHQEDCCQALGIMPSRKYENEGGPGIRDVVTLLRDASLQPRDDVERFVRSTALNWIIAATDAHAKNLALLHSPGGGVRLAPFYDILSYLPYAEPALHRVRLAMKIGTQYLVRRITVASWETLARATGMTAKYVLELVEDVLRQLPDATETVAHASIGDGLEPALIGHLAARISDRTRDCAAMLAHAPRTGAG